MTPSMPADIDLACTTCGYSLHALDVAGACPECGRAVAQSLDAISRREATFGPPLRVHSAMWLRTAGIGFFVFLLGLVTSVIADFFVRPASARWWVLRASDLVAVVGVWLLTIRPMQPKRRGEVLRWTTRILLTAWLIGNAITDMRQSWKPAIDAEDIKKWMTLAACAFGTVAGYLYLAHLAGRMRKLVVRRVFVVLAISSLLMVVSLRQTRGIYRPGLFYMRSLWPMFPFVAQAEDLLGVRYQYNIIVAHQGSFGEFVREVVLVCIWCPAAISAMLWYGLILLGIGSRRAERDAMKGDV